MFRYTILCLNLHTLKVTEISENHCSYFIPHICKMCICLILQSSHFIWFQFTVYHESKFHYSVLFLYSNSENVFLVLYSVLRVWSLNYKSGYNEHFKFLGGYVFFETSLLGATPDTRVAQNAFLDSAIMDSTGPEGKCLSFRCWWLNNKWECLVVYILCTIRQSL
jgi:hypothetical protein